MAKVHTLEFVALLPISALAVVYWLRNLYMFNRGLLFGGCRVSRAQLISLALMLFVWTVVVWCEHLQVSRLSSTSFVSAIGRHVLAHMAAVTVYNDSIYQTRQQLVAFLLGVPISYLWTVTSTLMYRATLEMEEEKHVCD